MITPTIYRFPPVSARWGSPRHYLQPNAGRKDSLKLLDGLPLATLEGEGNFRAALAQVAKKAKVNVNIQIECSSFPLVACAVVKGKMAAILPAVAAADLPPSAATQITISFLKSFDREICLASNPRLMRIRPILNQACTVLSQSCHFRIPFCASINNP